MTIKSAFDIESLVIPEIWKEKTKWEKRLEKIPVIGSFLAALIENDRFCRARAEIYTQISERPSIEQRQFYRADEETIIIQIATIIMYEMNWPTNIFSLNDTLEILIFDEDMACNIFEKIEILFDIPENYLIKYYDAHPDTTFVNFIHCVVRSMGTR
jgi:hypothetical protein